MSNQFIFDPNQTEFPSDNHRAIWERALWFLPEDVTLSDKVKSLMSDELFESCTQLRNFAMYLFQYQYNHATPNYFPYDLEFMKLIDRGEDDVSNGLVLNTSAWTKSFKEKTKGQFEHYATLFANVGINVEERTNGYVITNTLYPKMFIAMRAFRKLTASEATTIFYRGDFRKLCPGYKYDKIDSKALPRETFTEVATRCLNGEKLENALDFYAFLRANKLTPQMVPNEGGPLWASRNKTPSGGSSGVCKIGMGENNWSVSPTAYFEDFEKYLPDETLQQFIGDIYSPTQSVCGTCKGFARTLFGRLHEGRCRCHPLCIGNPSGADLETLKRLILYSKEIMSKWTVKPKLTKKEIEEKFNLALANLIPRGEAVDIDLKNMIIPTDLSVTIEDDQLIVKKIGHGWPRIESQENFSGFVKIEGCISANMQKVKIHYGDSQLFPMTKKKNFAFFEPGTSKVHFLPNNNEFPPDGFFEFEWYIAANFMAVVVNGKLWHYSEEYEYMEKLAETPLPPFPLSIVMPKAEDIIDYLRVTEI